MSRYRRVELSRVLDPHLGFDFVELLPDPLDAFERGLGFLLFGPEHGHHFQSDLYLLRQRESALEGLLWLLLKLLEPVSGLADFLRFQEEFFVLHEADRQVWIVTQLHHLLQPFKRVLLLFLQLKQSVR